MDRTSRRGSKRSPRQQPLPKIGRTSPAKRKDWVSVYAVKEMPHLDSLACNCSACKSTRPAVRAVTASSGKRDTAKLAALKTKAPFRVGDRCILKGDRIGVVRWIGEFDSAFVTYETFVGVQLDDPIGNHNGTHKGKRYFKCRDHHGIFVHKKDVLYVRGRHELQYRPVNSVIQEKQRAANQALSATRRTTTKPKTRLPKIDSASARRKAAEEALATSNISPVLRKLREAQLRGEKLIEEEGRLDDTSDVSRDKEVVSDSSATAAAEPIVPLEDEAQILENVKREVDAKRRELDEEERLSRAASAKAPEPEPAEPERAPEPAPSVSVRPPTPPSDELMQEVMSSIFQRADANGDGVLDASEFPALLSSPQLNLKLSDEQYEFIMQAVDTDQNGRVDYNEFMASFSSILRAQLSSSDSSVGWVEVFHHPRGIMIYFNPATSEVRVDTPQDFVEQNRSIYRAPQDPLESMVLSAFIGADLNSDGFLDEEEFWSVLQSPTLALTLDQELIDDIYKRVEVNERGLISFPQFVPVARRLLARAFFSHLAPAQWVAYDNVFFNTTTGESSLQTPESYVQYAPPPS